MTCLDTSPAFLQRRLELGLHQALPFIDAERMPCAAWATLAWARWITLFGGEAAAVDLEEVSRLADHVAAHGDASAQSLALWAQALVELSRPSWVDGEPGKGRTLLERAIQLDRAQLARHEDLLVRVAVPTRDRALFEDRQA